MLETDIFRETQRVTQQTQEQIHKIIFRQSQTQTHTTNKGMEDTRKAHCWLSDTNRKAFGFFLSMTPTH